VAGSVVVDAQMKRRADALHANTDRSNSRMRRVAVADRILDQWLKQERWNERVRNVRHRFDVHPKPAAEPRGHQSEVAPQHVELLSERHFLRMRRAKRQSQQLRQLADHAIRAPRVIVHGRRDRVQRVEQKVGLKLQPQVPQLGLRESSLELRCSNLALTRHPVVPIQRDDRDERRIADRVLSDSIT